MTLDDFIKEAKEISGRATSGPWTNDDNFIDAHIGTMQTFNLAKTFLKNEGANADFIAFSRNNFDKLIRIVEIQRKWVNCNCEDSVNKEIEELLK